MGNDVELLHSISTANVACGFHGGDPVTMVRTVEQAVELDVAVGAHPGLPDLLGFGRRAMDISPDDAHAYVLYQTGALMGTLQAHGAGLHHVKPHGALYSMLNERDDLAEAVADAIARVMETPIVYWPAGAEDGALIREALRRDFRVVFEFYPDLRYGANGRLIVERQKSPVDPRVAVERVARFLSDGTVETVDGGTIRVEADSVCVHGDGPTAPDIVTAVREYVEQHGCRVHAADGRTIVSGTTGG